LKISTQIKEKKKQQGKGVLKKKPKRNPQKNPKKGKGEREKQIARGKRRKKIKTK